MRTNQGTGVEDFHELFVERLMGIQESSSAVHNVLFGQFEFLATEQAETYLKICVLIYHLTYICPSLFDCEVNMKKIIFVIFKL